MVDPTCGSCTGSSTTTVGNMTSSKAAEVWVTQEELEGPRYLNSKTHAKTPLNTGHPPNRPVTSATPPR